MAFDTMTANWGNPQDSTDFFGQFKAEIDVALECIYGVLRMKGCLGEALSFIQRATKANADVGKTGNGSSKAATSAVQVLAGPLPLGLKTDSKPSAERVRSGGEIVQRSRREFGLFASKKRRSYAVHRISEETLREGGGMTILEEAGHRR